MSGFAFHPGALSDLDEIWDFISADNLDAADRVTAVAYAFEEKPLWIVAVMHGRRDPRVLAGILRGRE